MSSKPLPSIPKASSHSTKTLFSSLHKSYETSRNWAVRVVGKATRWKDPEEQFQIAISSDRRHTGLTVTLHAIPAAAALALITINLRPTYVGALTTTTRTALQFAAKFLESMIQASLAAIVLYLIRLKVLGSTSIPLGTFLASYRVTDISYLWSLELWGLVTASCKRRMISFAVLIPCIVILVTLIGPSSAVLMIPRPIHYRADRFLVLSQENVALFPREVGFQNESVENSFDIQNTFLQLTEGLQEIAANGNIQIKDDTGARIMENRMHTYPHSIENGNGDAYRTSTSTLPTQPALRAVWKSSAIGNKVETRKTQSLQPYVQQSCHFRSSKSAHDLDGQYVSFGDDYPGVNNLVSLHSRFSSETEALPELASRLMNSTMPFANFSLSWYETPQSVSNLSLLTISVQNSGHSISLNACTVSAMWVKASINVTAWSEGVQAVSVPEKGKWLDGASQAIHISPSWAMKAAGLFANSTISTQGCDGIRCLSTYFDWMNSYLALALADLEGQSWSHSSEPTIFTKTNQTSKQHSFLDDKQYDSLVKYIDENGYRHQYTSITVYNLSDWKDPASLAHFSIQQYMEGNGYDSSTVPVQLSITVLCIYSAIVLTFMVFVLISGRTGSGWASIGEVVMLALNSKRPKHLLGVNVSVNTLATYREPVNILVENKRGSVELVFHNDPGFKKAGYSVVEPDIRY